MAAPALAAAPAPPKQWARILLFDAIVDLRPDLDGAAVDGFIERVLGEAAALPAGTLPADAFLP